MKRFYRFLFLPLLLVMVACGSKSAKEIYIDRLKESQSAKQSAYEISLSLKEAETEEVGYNPFAGFVGQELTFHINHDRDKNLLGLKADLSVINPEWSSFEMIYADDKAYMSVAPLMALSGAAGEGYEGKYVDLEEMSGQSLPALSSFSPKDYQNIDLYEAIDVKHFSKKGDEVVVTLKLPELLELTQKNLKKTDKAAADSFVQQQEEVLKQFSSDSKAEIAIDKEGNGHAEIRLVSSGEDKSKLTLAMTFKKVAYKAPTAPSEKNVLSIAELSEAVMPEEDMDSQLSSADFDEFYASLESSISEVTEEELKQLIEVLEPSLTADQIKKLEELLPKTKDNE